ncbi:YkgJ family cysteine cluster protein [Dokdonella sp.]|uniref:YkgJ family cysteine cluster protein n=1 Tax=Dokdonella sp. TaxID=2291710 RepID=UPI001B2D9899|nr:YkgJ family cysteine cluster protein [Dokdonella sp.]MBO9664087.1 YkgJ family cysteine cluster protein [Dokdonella sp.]
MTTALAIEVVDEVIDANVRCTGCEAVCCRLPVLLMPGDAVPLWAIDVDEYGLEHMAQRDDGWCTALDRDTMRCTIYAQRPQVCRDFAMGGAGCLIERAEWYGDAASKCG